MAQSDSLQRGQLCVIHIKAPCISIATIADQRTWSVLTFSCCVIKTLETRSELGHITSGLMMEMLAITSLRGLSSYECTLTAADLTPHSEVRRSVTSVF